MISKDKIIGMDKIFTIKSNKSLSGNYIDIISYNLGLMIANRINYNCFNGVAL